MNANGVPSSSPGLRVPRYPGIGLRDTRYPRAGLPSSDGYPGIPVAHPNRSDANQPHRGCASNNARISPIHPS